MYMCRRGYSKHNFLLDFLPSRKHHHMKWIYFVLSAHIRHNGSKCPMKRSVKMYRISSRQICVENATNHFCTTNRMLFCHRTLFVNQSNNKKPQICIKHIFSVLHLERENLHRTTMTHRPSETYTKQM